jgi:hypothetical protein
VSIQIVPVATKAELERFIRVPMRLNAGDPNWVSPLMLERREALSPKTNPLFEHLDHQFFLAVRDGRDVGRISAQIDRLAPTDPDRPAGFFGMISGEDDADVFAALFAAAEGWLRTRGRKVAMGPFNLSINEETGLLVDGFDTPPMLLMGHDPAYAGGRIEQQGYVKAKDMFAYITGVPQFSPGVRARLDRPLGADVVMRPVDMSRWDDEIADIVEIYNDAWAGNWGFVPLTQAESRQLGKSMRPIIEKTLIWILEIEGEPAAFGILLRNVNEAIRDLDGRLLPFGWAKLLWRLKTKAVRTARVPLMGVKRKFARDPRGVLAPFQIIERLISEGTKVGIDQAECSWILEDNRSMNHILQSFGARPYKTYRVYEKAL